MEVTVLGVGSIYSKYNCASLLIDKRLLVDVGPGIIKYLLRNDYDLTKIDNIIITHLHSDHILDLPTFVINVDERGIEHKINIYGPEGCKEKLLELLNILYGDWFDEFVDNHFNFINIKDGFDFKIDDYNFRTREVKHPGILSYGFIVSNGLGISGDTSLCENVEDIIKSSKIIITDCSFTKGNDYHMGIDDIKYLGNKYPNKKMILTHFRDETCEELKEKRIDNVLVVKDGYRFKLGD